MDCGSDTRLAAFDEGEVELAELSAVEAVDLLERACAWGRLDLVRRLYEKLETLTGDPHPFAYESWALALSLRCGHDEVARELLGRGVDLLAPPKRPPQRAGGLLPPDDTFTRFALTRKSPTLLQNPMDPTVSTEAFRGFHVNEQLAGRSYEPPVDLEASCRLIAGLADEGAFEPTVFCDLFRASLVHAWHAQRHADKDDRSCDLCLDLCHHLLELHRSQPDDPRFGDERLFELMGKLVVPRGSVAVDEFVCREEPSVFFAAASELDWLRDDVALLQRLMSCVDLARTNAVPASQVASVLALFAGLGDLANVRRLAQMPQADEASVRQALEAASEAGAAEVAAYLLSLLPAAESASPFDDLLL